MTLEDRAEELMQEILSFGLDRQTIARAIDKAMRDQRNACADAIRNCEPVETKNRIRLDEAVGSCLQAEAS